MCFEARTFLQTLLILNIYNKYIVDNLTFYFIALNKQNTDYYILNKITLKTIVDVMFYI